VVASNTLHRQFEVDAPDKVWVTDTTYIKTHEAWPYLAVVIDLFSRRVVGWSVQPRMTTEACLAGLARSRLAAQTQGQGEYPFRPGIAVHQP
jgi:putative transposase